MRPLVFCALKFKSFLITASILIMFYATVSFCELSSVNAQNTNGEVNLLNNQGLSMADSGNFTEAIKYYDKALAIDPDNPDALDNKVLTLSNFGNQNMSYRIPG